MADREHHADHPVRPVATTPPPDQAIGGDGGGSTREPGRPPGVGLVLLLVAGAAIVFAVVTSGVFTVTAPTTTTTTIPDDLTAGAEPPTTTTTTTAPPTFADRVPFLAEVPLTLVEVAGDTGARLARWTARQIEPATEPLEATPIAAKFDASGTWLAMLDDSGTLHVGLAGFARPRTRGVGSFAWHPTDPLRLAIVVPVSDPEQGSRAVLQELIVTPSSGTLDSRVIADDLPADAVLAGWGDWGYLIQHAVPGLELPIAHLRDANGDVTAVAPGMIVDVNRNGLALVRSSAGAYEGFVADGTLAADPPEHWTDGLPPTGLYVADLTAALGPDGAYVPLDPPEGYLDAILPDDAEWIALTRFVPSTPSEPYRLEFHRTDGRGVARQFPFQEIRLLQFTEDSTHAVIQETDEDGDVDVVFVNRRTGAILRLPAGGPVLDVVEGREVGSA